MELRTAERKKAKLRIGLTAPSGGGKTYSALLIARGLASAWEKIALIDTENGSGELYSHLGKYQVLTLEAPFSPERYIEAIKTCERAGMEVIVIDSATHEWDGKGGCLESNEILANSKFKGNTWAAWSETTPKHRSFLEAILQSSCDIVTTTRSKTDTIQTDDKKIKKVGLKEIQREGYEYELTLNLNIDRDTHRAIASKDRTGLFEGLDPFIVTEETGRKLKEWNASGAAQKFYCKACPVKFNKQTEITESEAWETFAKYKVAMCADCVKRAEEKAKAFANPTDEITTEDIAAVDAGNGGAPSGQPPAPAANPAPVAAPKVSNVQLLKEYEPLVNGCMTKEELAALRDELAKDERVNPFAKKTIDRMMDEREKGINAGL